MGIYASDIEYWKDVANYEDRYEVSTHGRVRSKSYLKCGVNAHGVFSFMTKPKILRLPEDGAGYPSVDLRRDGERNTATVHTLVAKTFIENPLSYSVVHHKDSNKSNNHIQNLEWTTQQMNVRYSYDCGNSCNKGDKHPRSILTESIVKQLRLMKSEGKSYKYLANLFNVSVSTVTKAVTGKNWSHVL